MFGSLKKGVLSGARLSPGQQKLLSLVGELEGGCIRLHQLELRHPLISTTALRQQAYSHYMRAALPEIVKLVGSTSLLGKFKYLHLVYIVSNDSSVGLYVSGIRVSKMVPFNIHLPTMGRFRDALRCGGLHIKLTYFQRGGLADFERYLYLCTAGDPVSIFHHLGLGFWSFLAHPAAGLVESARGQGPQRIAVGFAGGLQSLLSNTIFAFSNATAKASGSARKVT